ncbi:MAG: hypothetical protein JRI23_09570 [Deltaproteobacteria bacterium]|jgi:rubrerythrin|nr:hypothetical protein [Deltaproteobacteria bacterium]MBW2531898.1 hypothetical protein [Deltaproteobacteria bacterium]
MDEEFTLRKSIELAITTEEMGSKFYSRLASKFDQHPALNGLFHQLALEEKEHHVQVADLLELAPASLDDKVEFERPAKLRGIAISEFFSTKDGPFQDIDQIDSEIEGVERALAFEQTTLALYRGIREKLGPRKPLDLLVNMEEAHVQRLSSALSTLQTMAKMTGG